MVRASPAPAGTRAVGIFKVCYQEVVTDGVNEFLVGLCPLSASAEAITLAATEQRDAGEQRDQKPVPRPHHHELR
jgi:hypothetical protein